MLMDAVRLYDVLERLGNLLRSEEREAAARAGLLPVHLAALGYLGRANRYSNTPAALAEYLGLTKGTVSQSLLVLERRGYLRKQGDSRDRRVVRLELTARGRRALERQSPPAAIRMAAEELGAAETDLLTTGLDGLLRAMQRARGNRSFGVCRTCRFFERGPDGFRCGLTHESLSAEDSERICREHESLLLPAGLA
jgi:DNA-binding MarR family transcriptional regulator